MDTREAQAQASFGRPGCFDTALGIGFVKSQDRSRLRCAAAANCGAKAASYVDVFMAAINWPAVQRAYDGLQT